jgi:carbonic anhydrase/acetyltransferase-like protein (isoleucine patch superfamily)
MTKLGKNIRPNPRGDWPQIDKSAYVDLSAQVIGLVRIGPRVFIGPNVVIRADEVDKDGQVKPIVIEALCNVQDGVIIHALAGTEVTIGQLTSLAHGAIVHGPCSVGERCFVGFGAVLFKTKVGTGVFIGPRAVVQEAIVPANKCTPPCAFICQDQVSQLRQTTPQQRGFMEEVTKTNLRLVEGYLRLQQIEGADSGKDR